MSSSFKFFSTLVLFVSQLFLCLPLYSAENTSTCYVSDFLIINLRDKIESPYSVVARLRSNDMLTVLQEKGKYIQVKTDANITGWVSKQYTTDKIPKALIIEELQNKIKELESRSLPTVATDTNSPELAKIIEEQKAIIVTLEEKLANTPNTAETDNTYKDKYLALEQEYAELEKVKNTAVKPANIKALITLQQENARLQNKQYIYLFLAGALTLIFGIFLGKTPDKRRQKRLFF